MALQNKVRIIGGAWRRRMISFPVAEGLRPSADRVRETLFNWLGQTLDGKVCLDLFAGSGVLGFEALSRGAAKVVMVEKERSVVRSLQENAANLSARNLEIITTDALHYLPREVRQFDVIFLDPPFHKEVLTLLFPFLETRLNPGGMVYAESEKPLEPGAGWQIWREGRAGKVFFYVLMRGEAAP